MPFEGSVMGAALEYVRTIFCETPWRMLKSPCVQAPGEVVYSCNQMVAPTKTRRSGREKSLTSSTSTRVSSFASLPSTTAGSSTPLIVQDGSAAGGSTSTGVAAVVADTSWVALAGAALLISSLEASAGSWISGISPEWSSSGDAMTFAGASLGLTSSVLPLVEIVIPSSLSPVLFSAASSVRGVEGTAFSSGVLSPAPTAENTSFSVCGGMTSTGVSTCVGASFPASTSTLISRGSVPSEAVISATATGAPSWEGVSTESLASKGTRSVGASSSLVAVIVLEMSVEVASLRIHQSKTESRERERKRRTENTSVSASTLHAQSQAATSDAHTELRVPVGREHVPG